MITLYVYICFTGNVVFVSRTNNERNSKVTSDTKFYIKYNVRQSQDKNKYLHLNKYEIFRLTSNLLVFLK